MQLPQLFKRRLNELFGIGSAFRFGSVNQAFITATLLAIATDGIVFYTFILRRNPDQQTNALKDIRDFQALVLAFNQAINDLLLITAQIYVQIILIFT